MTYLCNSEGVGDTRSTVVWQSELISKVIVQWRMLHELAGSVNGKQWTGPGCHSVQITILSTPCHLSLKTWRYTLIVPLVIIII